MTRGAAAATALAALGLGLSVVALLLLVRNWPAPLHTAEWPFPGFQGLTSAVFTGVGAWIAIRRPGNPIGWLILVSGVMSALQFAGHQYAIYGLVVAPDSVPAPSLGTWIEEWIWVPVIAGTGVFTFLLFPSGRLLSPRWRIVGWLAIAAIALATTGLAFEPTARVPGAVNPLLAGGRPAVADLLIGTGLGLLGVVMLAASASLFLRYRRSRGVERQQLKWLAFGALVVGLAQAVYTASIAVTGTERNPMSVVLAISLLFIPLTIALAMLRYGLYEVDRLINRTVVYGLVSVVLLGLYAASVLVLQAALTWLTNGDTLAVAGSTLLVAAIFQPARRWVQTAVDRRFNRARYDARRTAEAFGTRLRDQVDLHELSAELGAVVADTMQPTAIAIWLRRTGR